MTTTAAAQFVSGLTLQTLGLWKVCAPYLIMLGGTGICEIGPVLNEIVLAYKHVFIVPGPEAMIAEDGVLCQRMNYTTAPLRRIAAKYTNVSVLCRDTYDVGLNTRLIGLPWWPYIPDTPKYKYQYTKMLMDMEDRCEPHVSSCVDMQNRMSAADRHWLDYQLVNAEMDAKRVIVASHYSPTYAVIPEALHVKKHLYASPADNFGPIEQWIFGVGTGGISGMVGSFHVANNPIGLSGFTPFVTIQLV